MVTRVGRYPDVHSHTVSVPYRIPYGYTVLANMDTRSAFFYALNYLGNRDLDPGGDWMYLLWPRSLILTSSRKKLVISSLQGSARVSGYSWCQTISAPPCLAGGCYCVSVHWNWDMRGWPLVGPLSPSRASEPGARCTTTRARSETLVFKAAGLSL